MKKISEIVLHTAFQCISLALGGLFILSGLLSLLFEYLLSHQIPDYIFKNLIPLPAIGLIIILFSAVLSAICRWYERKAKVRKTEECEGASATYKEAKIVTSVANNRYFIEYKGVKIAEINHNGELITILVPDLYEEYKNE